MPVIRYTEKITTTECELTRAAARALATGKNIEIVLTDRTGVEFPIDGKVSKMDISNGKGGACIYTITVQGIREIQD